MALRFDIYIHETGTTIGVNPSPYRTTVMVTRSVQNGQDDEIDLPKQLRASGRVLALWESGTN